MADRYTYVPWQLQIHYPGSGASSTHYVEWDLVSVGGLLARSDEEHKTAIAVYQRKAANPSEIPDNWRRFVRDADEAYSIALAKLLEYSAWERNRPAA